MTRKQEVRGDIPAIIKNGAQMYDGDLIYYFRIIFHLAKNLHNPYHNFGHLFYVLWRCHQACVFYKKVMSGRERRNLLIAAMFHDVDHTGKAVPDKVNITRTLATLKKNCAFEDKSYFQDIVEIIEQSEYPYQVPSSNTPLAVQILRDADASQALSPTWIQHSVFGLAAEHSKTPLETLEKEIAYLTNLKFETAWAQRLFPAHMVEEKLDETQELLDLLYKGPAH